MKRFFTTLCICLSIAVLGISSITEAKTMNNENLTAQQQQIVSISALTAKGDIERLPAALNNGLDAGLTISEINEVLVQLYAYCGFPRSLNALNSFMSVVESRKAKGLRDAPGKQASPLPAGKSRLELGTEVQTKLVGAPVSGPLFEFAPAIDAFLKDHLFGDIFGRDALSWQNREIATVAALASMDGVGGQLQSHLSMSMNAGVSKTQLQHLVTVLTATVGQTEGDNAKSAMSKMQK